MVETSATYNSYGDARRVELSFVFGVIAPDAAELAQPVSSAQSPVSQIAQTHDDVEQMSGKYTSLETNLFLLDGTMQLYPDDVTDLQTGWQSGPLSDDEGVFAAPPWLEFSFAENQDSYGFTLLFDDTQPDNYPSEVTATAYGADGTQLGTLTTRPDGALHIINLAVQDYRRVRFTFGKTSLPNRRVRVCGVRFGINYEYNRTNIERITVRQSVSPWCESLPSAEVEATVNNSGQLYNMINPDGLYAYLQDGQYMEWTVSIDGEKIDMGRQYFTSAQSEDGGLTASITFNDRLLVLDDMEFSGGANGTWTLSDAITALLTASGTGITATFDGTLGSTVIRKCIPQKTSIREAIRLCAQAAMCTCYMDRQNTLHFFTPAIGAPADEWTQDVQRGDAQVKVGQLYNVVQLTVGNEYVDAEDVVYTAENVAADDFERVYEVTNPLVSDGDAVAQWLLGWVQRRVTYEVTTRGNPALDLLDTVQIDDVYNVNGNALLTQLNYSYDGGLKCDAAAIR